MSAAASESSRANSETGNELAKCTQQDDRGDKLLLWKLQPDEPKNSSMAKF